MHKIKRHLPFIDETFAIASSVRKMAKVTPLKLLEDIVLPASEKRLIQKEMRSKRTDEKYIRAARELRLAEKKTETLKNIYSRTLPLSSKLILQYENEKHAQVLAFFNVLSGPERRNVKMVVDGQLVDYKEDIVPKIPVKLGTQLKPYFSNVELSFDLVLSHLSQAKQKAQDSVHNAIKNRHHQRRKVAAYKYKKLEHFISIVTRIERTVTVYGKTIKGVKSHIKLNDQLFPWPKHLIGNFERLNAGVLSYNRSILSEHSVIIPASGEVPILSFDTLYIFCRNSKETLSALAQLSPHELKKFQAFSHYETAMSSDYPIKNSIDFPYDY